jgi:hypothetical protein
MAINRIEKMGICRANDAEDMPYTLLSKQVGNSFRQLDVSHDAGG